MGLFSSKPTVFAGIDIGGSGIKAVILEKKNNRAVLKDYAIIELSGDWPRQSTDALHEEAVAYLKELGTRLELGKTENYTALPTFAVFSSLVQLPNENQKQLEASVQSEIKKFVPLSLEELSIDYKILSRKEALKEVEKKNDKRGGEIKKAETVRVLLTAASREIISRYADLFNLSSLKLGALETEAFALARAFLGNDASTVMVVDLGSRTTDIVVYEEGVPSFNRTLDLGGHALTTQLEKQLGLDAEAAEQMKRDIGLPASEPTGTTLEKLHASPLELVVAPVLNEVKYSFGVFERQRKIKIEKIILTGGTSYIPNLAKRIEESLEVRVLLGNPWARVSTPDALDDALREIAPRMAVAVGCALRGVDES